MSNFIKATLKWVFFSAVVLSLGNLIQIKNKTLSDQIRLSMSHPQTQKWIFDLRSQIQFLLEDCNEGFHQQQRYFHKQSIDQTKGSKVKSSNFIERFQTKLED